MLNKTFYSAIFILLLLCPAAFAQKISSINVEKKGMGKQSVILLAGLGTPNKVWDETMDRLSGANSFYAISFSGFAGNKAQTDPNLALWEKDLAKFIEDQKLKKPILIGHSLGGTLALKIAADHPNLFSKIVIVDALPSPAAISNPNFKSKENLDCTPFIKQFGGMSKSVFSNFLKNMISQMVTDEKRKETLLGWFAESGRKTFGEIYCELLNIDLRKEIAGIKSPTLVMFQPLFKSKESEVRAQYKLLTNVDIRFAEKGLHFIMYDDPEWFFDNLRSFLKE